MNSITTSSLLLSLCLILVNSRSIFNGKAKNCCLSLRGDGLRCPVSGATSASDGSIHLIVGYDEYVRVDGIRANGFPIVNHSVFPMPLKEAFPGVELSRVRELMRLDLESMLLVGDSVAYEYNDVNKKVISKHFFNCANQTHNLFCAPDDVGTIQAIMRLKHNYYWANVHKRDGSFENILLNNNQVIGREEDKSGLASQAILLYNNDNSMSYGYDFLTEGRALPFILQLKEDKTLASSRSKAVKIDVRAAEVAEKLPGLELKVFYGCPQSFCWNNDLDAAMTQGKNLIIFRGNFYWKIPFPDRLPFQTPSYDLAKEIMIPGIDYVDAATELDSEDKGFLLFRDNMVYRVSSVEAQTVDDSMTIEEFIFGDKRNRDINFIHSALFNHLEKTLILFRDDEYFELKENQDKQFRLQGNDNAKKILSNFKINAKELDAAFSMEGTAILLKRNWFYVLPEKDWQQPSVPYGAELSLGSKKHNIGLFDVRESCSFSDHQFVQLQRRMERDFGLVDPNEEGRFIKTSKRQKAEKERKGDPNAILDVPVDDRSVKNKTNHEQDPDASTPKWVWPTVLSILLIFIVVVVVFGIIYSLDSKNR